MLVLGYFGLFFVFSVFSVVVLFFRYFVNGFFSRWEVSIRVSLSLIILLFLFRFICGKRGWFLGSEMMRFKLMNLSLGERVDLKKNR